MQSGFETNCRRMQRDQKPMKRRSPGFTRRQAQSAPYSRHRSSPIKAMVCKTIIGGSIPPRASNHFRTGEPRLWLCKGGLGPYS